MVNYNPRLPNRPNDFLLRQSTDDSLIYSNLLIYSPEASLDGLLRLEGVTIPVECHYNK